jgi:hypothetical protein
MELCDPRRLTGPNLLTDHPGALEDSGWRPGIEGV